jgi:hypothetical protein
MNLSNPVFMLFYGFVWILATSSTVYILAIKLPFIEPDYFKNHKFSLPSLAEFRLSEAGCYLRIIIVVVGLAVINLANATFTLIICISVGLPMFMLIFKINPTKSKNMFRANCLVAITLSTLWLIIPIWPIYQATFVILTYLGLVVISAAVELKIEGLYKFLAIVTIYDMFAVTTGILPDLISRSSAIDPGLLIIPRNPYTLTIDGNMLMILGSGDVIVGGIALFVARQNQVGKYAIIGYVAGIALTLVMSFVIQKPIPALVPIVPCIIASMKFGFWLQTPMEDPKTFIIVQK